MNLTFPHGLNENEQPAITEAFKGSYNFDLAASRSSLRPRLFFDSDAVSTNAGDIRGIMQLIKADNTDSTIVQSGGVVYSWDGTASGFTSVGACTSTSLLRSFNWTLNQYAIIVDIKRATVVKKWDGTTYSTLSTGLVNLKAKYGLVHNNRVWFFNLNENSTELPHVIVASAFEDPTDCTTSLRSGDSSFATGNEAFFITMPDLKPINGIALIQNILLISTVEGRLYTLTGGDSTNYNLEPFYVGSAATGTETMANIGNDIVYLKDGGNIETLTSTEQFGDVSADDLSRFIPTTVLNLADCITVYDQVRQKVLFFISGKILVLYKDLLATAPGASPWSVYKTQHANGFTTTVASYIRIPGTTNYTVYFGGPDGEIYNLNGIGLGDGGDTDVTTVRKTGEITREIAGIDFEKQVSTGRVMYRRLAATPISLTFEWSGSYHTSIVSMNLKGPDANDTGLYYGGDNYYGDTNYYNTGIVAASQISHQGFSPTGKASGFQLTLQVDSSQTFQIDSLNIPDEVPQRFRQGGAL